MLFDDEKKVLDFLINRSQNGKYKVGDQLPPDYSSMPIESIFDDLVNQGYLNHIGGAIGTKFYKVTQKGLHYRDYEQATPSIPLSVVNVNAPITNAAIANSGTVNFNVTMDWEHIDSLIDQKCTSLEDQETAHQIVNTIKLETENGKPLQKGFLHRMGDFLVKHSWLTSAIANALMRYFIG